ncbi:MAG: hypothetical protein WDW36_000807 [Sanguina aurantia]
MVDRFKIAVYAADSSQQAAQDSRQPEVRHSGAVREVTPPRGYRQSSAGWDAAGTQAAPPPPRNTSYDTPASRVSHHSTVGNGDGDGGPAMRAQEFRVPPGRERELDAGGSRPAHTPPPGPSAPTAPAASPAPTAPGTHPSLAGGAAGYEDSGGYAQRPPARDSGGGYGANAGGGEQERSGYAPSVRDGRAAVGGPVPRPGLTRGYNAGSAHDGYTQDAVYLDPPPREPQHQQQHQQQRQQSYNGGGREAPGVEQQYLRYDDAMPGSRNGGGGDMYAPARGQQQQQQQPAPQGGTRHEADRYAAPERPSAPLRYANNGGGPMHAPARETLSPPALQHAPPPLLYDDRSSERAYQPLTAPPPMSGYHMSSMDSLPSSQYGSRGKDNAGPRGAAAAAAAAPEYQPAQRSDSGPQYSDDSYNPPSGNAARQTTYEPVMAIQRPGDGGGMRGEEHIRPGGALVVSGYASGGYAPPREDVRQSGYAEDYQRGARVQAPATYEPAAAAVSYDGQQRPTYASRLPALDRGMDESRGAGMDGRGHTSQRGYPAREPAVQTQVSERQYGVREPQREYAQHPVRQGDRYEAPIQQQQQQGREPGRRPERELVQTSARQQPMQQQQQQFVQQPGRGSFQQDGHQDGPPWQPGGGDSRGGRGGGQQGAGGPQRGGPNTFRTVRDGRPY